PGVVSGLKMQASIGQKYKWSSISWNSAALPANTSISFQGRTSDDGSSWSGWSTASTPQTSGTSGSQSISNLSSSQWLEVQMNLASSDGISTPTLNDFTINYDTLENPVNSNIAMYKSDGSTLLKNSSGVDATAGSGDGWTNETAVKINVTGLTCGGGASGNPACVTGSTNLRPQIELKPKDTAFDGLTNLYQDGQAGQDQDSTINGTVYITGLTTIGGNGYHFRVRSTDDQSRVSGWTNYASDATAFTIEQTPPTISSFTINSGAAYTSNQNVTLNIS
ncbi:hypothetical protein COX25_00025, partial [bacterium (Candidatus Howlettbacteria) CG23_combo_of_CG06-09_8_20_14_all_37_9]